MINIYDTFEGNDNSSLLYFGIYSRKLHDSMSSTTH